MCLEKGQKFWKNQGKVREFYWEQNVETMSELAAIFSSAKLVTSVFTNIETVLYINVLKAFCAGSLTGCPNEI